MASVVKFVAVAAIYFGIGYGFYKLCGMSFEAIIDWNVSRLEK